MAATTVPVHGQDEATDVWSAVRLLNQMRRRRRSHLIGSHNMRSARRLIVLATIVVPGASFLFLGFAIAMAIAFGQAKTQDQAEALLATMLMVSFATALAGCLSTALQSLFMSQDVRFLVSLPLPVRAIYYDRFGDVARGAIPGGLFGLSICVGYVLGRAQDYRFVVFGMVAVFLLSATAISLAASTTAITVRFSSPAHSRRILVVASMILLTVTAVVWRLTGATAADRPDHPVVQAVLGALPSGWARSALVRSVGSDPQTALPYVALQVGILMLVTAAGATAFATTFTENIERTDLGAARSVRRRSSPVARRLLGLVPRTSAHWVRREWILISRDFSRVSAAILPMGSVVVWVILSFFWTSGTSSSPAGSTFWLTHAPILLLPWGISLGTTVFAIGCEGSGIDLLRTLPFRTAALMRAKYAAYFIPILVVSELAAVLSLVLRPGSSGETWTLLSLTAILTAVFCGVDLAMAATSPRFDSDHVQRSTGFVARMLAAFSGMAVAGAIVIGMSLSPFGDPALAATLGTSTNGNRSWLWLGIMVLAIGVPLTQLDFGRRRLSQILGNRKPR